MEECANWQIVWKNMCCLFLSCSSPILEYILITSTLFDLKKMRKKQRRKRKAHLSLFGLS